MTEERAKGQGPKDKLPRFLDAGEAALVVEFGTAINPAISEQVLALDAFLSNDPHPGILELVPTYRSLMVHYDPLAIGRDPLIARIREALLKRKEPANRVSLWIVPCCYEAEFAEDLGEVSRVTGIPGDRIVALQVEALYRIYMYGFAPGFTYLGGLPNEIAISRRLTPRPPHEAGAVLIGGGQCAISTFSMPTGWHVIGRTPERLYAPAREQPFLLEPGEHVRFEPVDAATFFALDQRAATGEIVARRTAR